VVRVNGITSGGLHPLRRPWWWRRSFRRRRAAGHSGQAALIHTDGWTWEDMAIERTAAIHLLFPNLGGRGGRGGGRFPTPFQMVPGGASAASFTAAKRAYDQQVAKINEFFDQARQYQELKAQAPGFETRSQMDAMVPILEAGAPGGLREPRQRHPRCDRVGGKAEDQDRDSAAAGYCQSRSGTH
jgi:hypothetical protein